MKLEVVSAGMFTTIQDKGRKGMMFYGIPRSGFMDQQSGKLANVLVGNKANNPLLEMTAIGGCFRFSDSATIAITGANMQPKVNGVVLEMYRTISVKKNDQLEFGRAINGFRTYLAIRGKWRIPKTLGSRSTYTYAKIGGLNGGVLNINDTIKIESKKSKIRFIEFPNVSNIEKIKQIKIKKGPEFSILSSQRFLKESFSIAPNSDRMGAALEGKEVAITMPNLFPSQATFPGIIQCTPAGKLIVVLQDGQTTGGYPRILRIPRKQLDRFNQLRPKQAFKFVF